MCQSANHLNREGSHIIGNAAVFKNKLRRNHLCLGTSISLADPAVTEALCGICDFVWIDMEHTTLSLEAVRAHVMATKGSETATLVRVPWNSPVLIKPVLDLGANGVIVPMVRSAEEAAAAVSACRYPPLGIRGFGPLRASNYGRVKARDFCEESDRTLMTVIQIEHIEAVENLDSILKVPGIQDIMIGPSDLAASMGHLGDTEHPDVVRAMEGVVQKACAADVNVGLATGTDPAAIAGWAQKGVRWFALLNDVMLLLQTVHDCVGLIRTSVSSESRAGLERTSRNSR